jgi:hypothetical protein
MNLDHGTAQPKFVCTKRHQEGLEATRFSFYDHKEWRESRSEHKA